MKNKKFELPEKWCVKVTKENADVLTDWKQTTEWTGEAHNFKYVSYDGIGCGESFIEDLALITFEQFKEYVLGNHKSVEQIQENMNKSCPSSLHDSEDWGVNESYKDCVDDKYIGKGILQNLGSHLGISMEEACEKLKEVTSGYADYVNPDHYKSGEVECIDAIKSAVVNKKPFEAVLVANVIKYLWRYESKCGLTDIKKASWYLEKLTDEVGVE